MVRSHAAENFGLEEKRRALVSFRYFFTLSPGLKLLALRKVKLAFL